MGRAVVGDEAIERKVEEIVEKGKVVNVGLLIGRVGGGEKGSRDLILGLVPTPVKEDGADAAELFVASSHSGSKKPRSGSAATGSISVDTEWIAEHARQVSRMLLGGIVVAGIYVLAPDHVFKQSTTIISQAAKAVFAASSSAVPTEGFVLHIATSPRSFYCKACHFEQNGSVSLKPCDWKMGKVISNLQSVTCSYVFDTSIPVLASDEGEAFKAKLLRWVATEAKALQLAEVLFDDVLLVDDQVLSLSSHNLQFLLPPTSFGAKDDGGPKAVAGIMSLKGSIHARAYTFPREPVSNAVTALKEDVVQSLQNRIELLCEESEAADKISPLLSSCEGNNINFTCVLPRRVLLPWNGLFICDYLQPNESIKDTEERLRDLFGQDLSGKTQEPEEFCKPSPPQQANLKNATEGSVAGKSNLTFWIGALLAALLAILAVLFLRN